MKKIKKTDRELIGFYLKGRYKDVYQYHANPIAPAIPIIERTQDRQIYLQKSYI